MSTEDFKRKLTAILSADVAGYSRLMGGDEEATVRTLNKFKEMIFGLIGRHNGRVVDSPGDNLLAEFTSVVDAVRCGVQIQEGLKVCNEGLWAGADKAVEPASIIFDRGIVKPGVDAGYQHQTDGCYTLPGRLFRTRTEYTPGTQPFLKVNRSGQRFANESSPYNDIVYAASHQPGHVYCQVYDMDYRKYWEQFHTIGCSAIPRLLPDVMSKLIDHYVEKGIIQKANTLSELADKLGFTGTNKTTFLATCERQNENYDNGVDPDFYKPKTRLSPIRKSPFYGVWMGGNILCTGDGIKINEKMQALNSCEEVIPGLYCAGNTAGCFFAGNYPVLFPGTAVGRAMTESLVAVKTIAGIS